MMEQLTKLCDELKINSSQLIKAEDGAYLLSLNESLTLAVKFLEPGVYFHGVIAPCPKEKREELFMLLMKANFLGQGTFGAAIGLTPDEKSLTLSLAFPYEMNYRTFRGMIEDFANTIDYWRGEVT